MRPRIVAAATFLALLLMQLPLLAEPANLEGGWTLTQTGKGLTRHLFFSAGGPKWKAFSNGKLMVTLDLAPTEQENQWTGVLKEWEEFKVRAVLNNANRLELQQVDGERSWTMERKKP